MKTSKELPVPGLQGKQTDLASILRWNSGDISGIPLYGSKDRTGLRASRYGSQGAPPKMAFLKNYLLAREVASSQVGSIQIEAELLGEAEVQVGRGSWVRATRSSAVFLEY